MTPAIILDVLIAAVLLTAVLRGWWRGLFLSLSGVVVLILAISGRIWFPSAPMMSTPEIC